MYSNNLYIYIYTCIWTMHIYKITENNKSWVWKAATEYKGQIGGREKGEKLCNYIIISK